MDLMQSDAKSATNNACAFEKHTQRLNLTMAHYLTLIANLPHHKKISPQSDAGAKRPLTLSRWVR